MFIKCYEKLDTFRNESTYKTWLIRITVNRCKDVFKSWSYRIDSKEFVPNLEGRKKESKIETGKFVDNEIPDGLKGQWEQAKKKTNETTLLHHNDQWFIYPKTGFRVDRIEVNGKTGKLFLIKTGSKASNMREPAFADGYNLRKLQVVIE